MRRMQNPLFHGWTHRVVFFLQDVNEWWTLSSTVSQHYTTSGKYNGSVFTKALENISRYPVLWSIESNLDCKESIFQVILLSKYYKETCFSSLYILYITWRHALTHCHFSILFIGTGTCFFLIVSTRGHLYNYIDRITSQNREIMHLVMSAHLSIL